MSKYGMYVKFVTNEGKREELTDNLRKVADMMKNIHGCELYMNNHSMEEENVIWVTEIWSSKDNHQESLYVEGSKTYIAASLPLIEYVEKIEVKPLGGLGPS